VCAEHDEYVGLPWDWECVASLCFGAWMVPVHGGYGPSSEEDGPGGL